MKRSFKLWRWGWRVRSYHLLDEACETARRLCGYQPVVVFDPANQKARCYFHQAVKPILKHYLTLFDKREKRLGKRLQAFAWEEQVTVLGGERPGPECISTGSESR